VNTRERTRDTLTGYSPGGHGYRGGEIGERIRRFDWATTPLGPINSWPQSLRTVVDILLSSRYAMWMAWGPELTMLYNDAYQPTLGIKHPRALGMRASEVWAEIWPDIGPRIETVLTIGEATYDEGLLLFLERSGFPEETYHTFSYSPLSNDDGQIAGMLCVVTEETERVIGERRVETLRDVASALASTNTEDEVLLALRNQLSLNQKDLPFSLTYLFESDGGARLASWTGIASDHPLAASRIEPSSNFPWPAHQILLHPATRLIESLSEQRKIAPLRAGDWKKQVDQAAIVPIRQQGQEKPAGFFVVGTNPYRRYDSAYSGFVDLLSGQIAAGLGNARAYEAERRRAEALAEIDLAKTTFFSNVSHELRTPLTLMLSPVEELLSHAKQYSPDERQLLDLVHRNGLRLQKLVNTLLEFTRIEAGRVQADYEPIELSQFTEELASNFRSAMERAGLRFEINCEPIPEPVYVDREMWEKVVLNLLSNALKFTFEGSVSVARKAAGRYARLTVRDTGSGIPPLELPRIFDRFHRVARAQGRTVEGTGIGLALVRELVHLHGGSITAESEVSKGTILTVEIPLGIEHLPADKVNPAREAGSPTSRSDSFVKEALRWLSDGERGRASTGLVEVMRNVAGGAASARTERVLLADDNADMREYITRLLGERYQVLAVSNGEEALRLAISESPDLILSDVMMPGLDGFALLGELRARPETKTIPVVLLSARAGEESRVEGLGAGADDYLIKPFTARELLARVAAHLSMRRRRVEAERELRESQTTLQSFYDSSPFLMGLAEIKDQSLVAIYFNTTAATFLTRDAKYIPGNTAEGLGVSAEIDSLWMKYFQQSQREGHFIRFEYQHPRPEGSCWLSACVNFLGNGPGDCPRFSFVAEDVTERKNNEALLRQANDELRRANADLEQFAYSASHDLQEPLRQIAVYSQMLEKKYNGILDGKASQYLAYCIDGAHRMEMLLDGLLAYSQVARTPDSPINSVDVGEVVDSVLKNLSTTIQEARAEISTSALPVVQGEPVPLVLLFQNLISNALKYRSKEKPRVNITASRAASHWLFAVEDNGIGIPKEFQTQIFGIFKRLHSRAQYSGTGIGLAICQKIVERNGGRIWVESTPESGSTFFFTLPISELRSQ
jgi:signal transduction histidine kinase/FixJ family two-component response regulator